VGGPKGAWALTNHMNPVGFSGRRLPAVNTPTLCFLRFCLTSSLRDLIHTCRSSGTRSQGEQKSAWGLARESQPWYAYPGMLAPASKKDAVQQKEEK
jgi:hypothetical protein